MAFKHLECVQPVCDHCENVVDGDYEAHWPSEADALEQLSDYEWLRTADGKLYCPECRYDPKLALEQESHIG